MKTLHHKHSQAYALQKYLNNKGLSMVEVVSAEVDFLQDRYNKRVELRIKHPVRRYIRAAAHGIGWHFAVNKCLIRMVEDLRKIAQGTQAEDVFSLTNMDSNSAKALLEKLDGKARKGSRNGR